MSRVRLSPPRCPKWGCRPRRIIADMRVWVPLSASLTDIYTLGQPRHAGPKKEIEYIGNPAILVCGLEHRWESSCEVIYDN